MKDYDTLVSIIVPVYGTEAYLSACIESICNQTYKNLQIILVDDQSPDRCPQICDKYAEKDERIIVIHQNNKGVSGARNTGMMYAIGNYTMFVDSDDELFPKAVEILLQDINEYDADIVWAPQRTIDKNKIRTNNSVEGEYKVFRGNSSLLCSLEGKANTNAVWGKIFRSEFIKGISFEEGKNINEDGFFMFQCYVKNPVLIQHNIMLYKYNNRINSCSRQSFSDKYFSMIYFCNRKKEIIADMYPQYIEHAYNMEVRTHLQFLQVLCRTNDKRYKDAHRESVKTVRNLYKFHKPINGHHKKLAWIVKIGFYSLYKIAIRLKYCK